MQCVLTRLINFAIHDSQNECVKCRKIDVKYISLTIECINLHFIPVKKILRKILGSTIYYEIFSGIWIYKQYLSNFINRLKSRFEE